MTHDPLEEVLGITRRPPPRSSALRSLANGQDCGHRITESAWKALATYHHRSDLSSYLLEQLQPLVPLAHAAAHSNYVLCTDYAFGTGNGKHTLWYRPNQYGGITISLPEKR